MFLTIQNPSLRLQRCAMLEFSVESLTLKSMAIQTEFEDAAMSIRVSTRFPPSTQANATKRLSLPTDELKPAFFLFQKLQSLMLKNGKLTMIIIMLCMLPHM